MAAYYMSAARSGEHTQIPVRLSLYFSLTRALGTQLQFLLFTCKFEHCWTSCLALCLCLSSVVLAAVGMYHIGWCAAKEIVCVWNDRPVLMHICKKWGVSSRKWVVTKFIPSPREPALSSSSSYQNKKLKVYVTKSELSFLPSITRVGSSTNRIPIVSPEPGQIGWISYLSFVLPFNGRKNRALCALWSPQGLKLVVEESIVPFFCSKKAWNFTACTWCCDCNAARLEAAKSISLQINFSKWRNAAETGLGVQLVEALVGLGSK